MKDLYSAILLTSLSTHSPTGVHSPPLGSCAYRCSEYSMNSMKFIEYSRAHVCWHTCLRFSGLCAWEQSGWVVWQLRGYFLKDRNGTVGGFATRVVKKKVKSVLKTHVTSIFCRDFPVVLPSESVLKTLMPQTLCLLVGSLQPQSHAVLITHCKGLRETEQQERSRAGVSTASRVLGWPERGYLHDCDQTMGSRTPDHTCHAHPSTTRGCACRDDLKMDASGGSAASEFVSLLKPVSVQFPASVPSSLRPTCWGCALL